MSAARPCYRHVDRVRASEGRPEITAAASVKLRIHGMACPNCTAKVHNALMRVDGVTEVEVWLRPAVAAVRYDSERASVYQLLSAVAAAGVGSCHHYRALPLDA